MIERNTASGVDAAARRAASALSRRESLLALGGAALGAVTASAPARAGNGRKGNSKRASKLAGRQCRRQGGQCRASLLAICARNGIDCDPLLPCCGLFARCEAAAAVTCIFGDDDDTARRAGLSQPIALRQ